MSSGPEPPGQPLLLAALRPQQRSQCMVPDTWQTCCTSQFPFLLLILSSPVSPERSEHESQKTNPKAQLIHYTDGETESQIWKGFASGRAEETRPGGWWRSRWLRGPQLGRAGGRGRQPTWGRAGCCFEAGVVVGDSLEGEGTLHNVKLSASQPGCPTPVRTQPSSPLTPFLPLHTPILSWVRLQACVPPGVSLFPPGIHKMGDSGTHLLAGVRTNEVMQVKG